MGYVTPTAYLDDLGGGVFRNEISLRRVAYLLNGSYRQEVLDWGDSGIVGLPHRVSQAKLQINVGNDGMRRFHPTGDPNKYLEIGAPFIQVGAGATWTQVHLGQEARTKNSLKWHTQNADFSIFHAGHYSKLEIELLNGFIPQNNRIAFPVGLSGFTRNGLQILDGGNVVSSLRPFLAWDAADPTKTLPIQHQFTSINGQPYLLLTLPDLSGFSRPIIDPTLTLQPDATDGKDTFIRGFSGGTENLGTSTVMIAGERTDDTGYANRALIQFDLSSIPSSAVVSSATLSYFLVTDLSSNSRVLRHYRLKRAWTELGVTYNKYDGTNNWATAGGFGATDCEQTDCAHQTYTASETLSTFKNMGFDATLLQEMISGVFANNGYLGKMDTEASDAYIWNSSDNSNAASRPKFVVVYTANTAGVSDSVAVSENIDRTIFSFIGKSDSTVLTESVNLTKVFSVSASDSVSLSDTDSLVLVKDIFVSDSLTVDESSSEILVHQISINETVSLTEFDSLSEEILISKNETITLTELVVEDILLNINVIDLVVVDEAQNILLPIGSNLAINVNDGVNVSDNYNPYTDYVNVTDTASASFDANITRSESVGLSESLRGEENSFIGVSQSITVAEDSNLINTILVETDEGILVSETNVLFFDLYLSTTQAVLVSESVNLQVQIPGQILINLNEAVLVTESLSLEIGLQITSSEDISLNESLLVLGDSLQINLVENLGVNDSPLVFVELFPFPLSVQETVLVDEDVAASFDTSLTILCTESILVSELLTLIVVYTANVGCRVFSIEKESRVFVVVP